MDRLAASLDGLIESQLAPIVSGALKEVAMLFEDDNFRTRVFTGAEVASIIRDAAIGVMEPNTTPGG